MKAPSPKQTGTSSQGDRLAGENEIRTRHPSVAYGRAGSSMANEDDIRSACRIPEVGRPAYDILLSPREPERRPDHHFRNAENLRNPPPTHPLTRVASTDPPSGALDFAGADIIPQHEFRAMGTHGDSECQVVGAHFKVSNYRSGDWGIGVKPGPHANGEGTIHA